MNPSKILLRGPYFPSHDMNRMTSEGDVISARKTFFSKRFRNLDYLLRQRYAWMNSYIQDDWTVIELGCGGGFSELYLKRRSIMTDVVENEWVDRTLDATKMDLSNGSVDCIIASHTIHHFYSPYKFFKEAERVLKSGGIILIQEINTSLAMRVLLRLMRHEGWSYKVDLFDEHQIANDPADIWSANCAIPEILFSQVDNFEKAFPGLTIEHQKLSEFLIFPLSGGVVSKTKVPELPLWLLELAAKLDEVIVRLFPNIFALGRGIVIRKYV